MKELNLSCKSFLAQIIHFVAVPVFFVTFMLIYAPFDSKDFIGAGRDLFSFNIVILSCIVLVTLVGLRLAFYFIWRKRAISVFSYCLWCVGEVLIIAHFFALFIVLMAKGQMTYFNVLAKSLEICFLVLVYPYALIGLVLSLLNDKSEQSDTTSSLIRFIDEYQRQKLVIDSRAILYISAEENYVRIFYLDAGKVKNYLLRNSMKSIDSMVSDRGLVRCQRSYYVNPQHVIVLRKDKEGQIQAELDTESITVPVSKTYYQSLSAVL